jgi:hypothetical protein
MITTERVMTAIKTAQIILGLRDWKITGEVVSQEKIREIVGIAPTNGEKILGCVLIDGELKQATITIWDNLDTFEHYGGLQQVVFHECLHIILYPLTKTFKRGISKMSSQVREAYLWVYSLFEEQIINQIANSLMGIIYAAKLQSEKTKKNKTKGVIYVVEKKLIITTPEVKN